MVLKEISTYLTENEKGKLPWNYQEMVEAQKVVLGLFKKIMERTKE